MTFRLFDLPAELRCLIYHEAITSGTMGILVASHQVHQEASHLVKKAGIFRIRTRTFGNEVYIHTPPLDVTTSTSIENIEISVAIEGTNSDYRSYNSDAVDVFTNAAPGIQRDTCYITFKMSVLTSLHNKPAQLLRSIKKLEGFKRIIVTAIATGSEACFQAQRVVIRARNKPTYEMLLKELEPAFGPGVWHDAATQDGRYLEFHPVQS